jgi:UDP-hydrolysing UDP-N-acetyl-D-glucosamine 2-epimerase
VRIISISSSRADVGILQPVWRALLERGADLTVIATGMHRAADAIPLDLGGICARIVEAGQDLGGCANASASSAMAAIAGDCGRLYQEIGPDMVLLTGDRLDMLPAAVAALPFNLPLVHLHGGEVTEGAIDDRARHAMTQMAHLHCVSSEGARRHIEAMLARPAQIVVTGAPGLDTLLSAPVLERGEFLKQTGLDGIAGADSRFLLATVHPETNALEPQAPLEAVLRGLDELSLPVLFTAPNSDPGGSEMRLRLASWISSRPFAQYIDTLGSRLYPNALRHAGAMVGNSSSGIIEAGLFGLPVINVGGRQKGRERPSNVIDVPNEWAHVASRIREALRCGRQSPASTYGDGHSGPRVAGAIQDFRTHITRAAKTEN